MKALQRIALPPPGEAGRRPGAAREADPELRDRLQAHPALERLVSGAPAAERRAGHRRHPRRSGPSGIVTADGRLHEVDTIVLATGFKVTDISLAHRIRGRGRRVDGRHLEGQPAGLPRHGGRRLPEPLLRHRAQHRPRPQLAPLHDRGAARATCSTRCARCDARGATRIEVRRDAQEAYNAYLQRRLVRSVWNTGGCSSWYLDATGRNTTIWPYFTWRYWQKTRRFDPAPYVLTNGASPAPDRSTAAAPPTPLRRDDRRAARAGAQPARAPRPAGGERGDGERRGAGRHPRREPARRGRDRAGRRFSFRATCSSGAATRPRTIATSASRPAARSW